MQKKVFYLVGVLLGSFFLLTGAAKSDKGRVTFLEGNAYVLKKSNKKQNLKIQSMISLGSKIITESSSAIEITFKNGSVIRISENAEVVLSDLDDQTSLELKKGKVWSNIQKLASGSGYSVKTNYATASVRGTIFNVMAQDSSTRVALYTGSVAVAPRKELTQEENGWGPPAEIGGPKEVSEEMWIMLDPGQMIDMNWDGTYQQKAIESSEDQWIKFNQQRDLNVKRPADKI